MTILWWIFEVIFRFLLDNTLKFLGNPYMFCQYYLISDIFVWYSYFFWLILGLLSQFWKFWLYLSILLSGWVNGILKSFSVFMILGTPVPVLHRVPSFLAKTQKGQNSGDASLVEVRELILSFQHPQLKARRAFFLCCSTFYVSNTS